MWIVTDCKTGRWLRYRTEGQCRRAARLHHQLHVMESERHRIQQLVIARREAALHASLVNLER